MNDDKALSDALLRSIMRTYHKLPEMLQLDGDLRPEEIMIRLVRFCDSPKDPLAGRIVASYILNRTLKELGEEWQPSILKLLEGVFL